MIYEAIFTCWDSTAEAEPKDTKHEFNVITVRDAAAKYAAWVYPQNDFEAMTVGVRLGEKEWNVEVEAHMEIEFDIGMAIEKIGQ